MTNLIGRRDLLAAGIGLYAGLTGSKAHAQAGQTSRETGTDALGRRVGTGSRSRSSDPEASGQDHQTVPLASWLAQRDRHRS